MKTLALKLLDWHGGQDSGVYAVGSCMLSDAERGVTYRPENHRGHADGVNAYAMAIHELLDCEAEEATQLAKTLVKLRGMDSFTKAYIECALWSSTDDDGNSLDRDHSISDLSPDTLNQMIEDCRRFQSENAELLSKAQYGKRWPDSEIAGHDFWLTRNRHGAGFWDGDLPDEVADPLTEAARMFGEVNLYVGDDEMVHAYEDRITEMTTRTL